MIRNRPGRVDDPAFCGAVEASMKNTGLTSVPASMCPSCGVISPEGAHAGAAACIRALEAELLQLREELKRLTEERPEGKEPA